MRRDSRDHVPTVPKPTDPQVSKPHTLLSGVKSTSTFLPYGRQDIEEDDIAEVVRVLHSDYLTTGPEVPAFEAAFAAAVGARHAIACANGTAALHLMAAASNLGPTTVSIVPTLTFLATANAVRLTGGEIQFADVDAETGLMTPATLRAAIARADKPVSAVFPVHLGGQTCDMPAIADIASAAGARVFEDACHAIGTRYATTTGQHVVGDCTHAAGCAFSLHPVKTIAAGEGGVVTTQDDTLAERVRLLRNHGMVRESSLFKQTDDAFAFDGRANPWYYEMSEPGLNFRLTDIQAALARSQLAKLARFSNQRQALAARYRQRLGSLAPMIRSVRISQDCDPVLHLFQVLIDFPSLGLDRATLIDRLRECGIGSQVHYFPVHRQPYYSARYPGLQLTGADAFYAATLSLPLYASMTDADVDRVVEALKMSITR